MCDTQYDMYLYIEHGNYHEIEWKIKEKHVHIVHILIFGIYKSEVGVA